MCAEAAVERLISISIFQYGVKGNADDKIFICGQIEKGMAEIMFIDFLVRL